MKEKNSGCGCFFILTLVGFLYLAAPDVPEQTVPIRTPATESSVSHDTVKVTFQSTPLGAKVFINNERKPRGITPLVTNVDPYSFSSFRLKPPTPIYKTYATRATIYDSTTFAVNFAMEARLQVLQKRRTALRRRAVRGCVEAVAYYNRVVLGIQDSDRSARYMKYKVGRLDLKARSVRVRASDRFPTYIYTSRVWHVCDYNDYTGKTTVELQRPE